MLTLVTEPLRFDIEVPLPQFANQLLCDRRGLEYIAIGIVHLEHAKPAKGERVPWIVTARPVLDGNVITIGCFLADAAMRIAANVDRLFNERH